MRPTQAEPTLYKACFVNPTGCVPSDSLVLLGNGEAFATGRDYKSQAIASGDAGCAAYSA